MQNQPDDAAKGVALRFLAIATAILVAVGLFVVLRPQRPPVPQAECAIAFDTFGTTSQMLPAYKQWLPGQVSGCAKAGRGHVDSVLISGDTATTRTAPVSLDLRHQDYTGNSVDDSDIADQAINAYTTRVENSLFTARPESTHGTDLIALGCVVKPLLHGHTPNTLIINTDGMNNRDPLKFYKVPLDDAHIQDYISQLKTSGQICDLGGTTVQMYGVGIGAGTNNLPAERLAQIQKFWQAYFAASNATLTAYQRTP